MLFGIVLLYLLQTAAACLYLSIHSLISRISSVYVDRPIEVKVPVKCEVPKVICTAGQATYTEEIREMRLCIERYKQAAAVCSK
jgi:hypothetical protein